MSDHADARTIVFAANLIADLNTYAHDDAARMYGATTRRIAADLGYTEDEDLRRAIVVLDAAIEARIGSVGLSDLKVLVMARAFGGVA